MSYAWRQEAHMNELEFLAAAVFLKRRARARTVQATLQVFPCVGFNGLPRSTRNREKQLTQVEQDGSEV